MKAIILAICIFLCLSCTYSPQRLTTDLIEQSETSFAAGRTAEIGSSQPSFCWTLGDFEKLHQTHYQILLATSPSLLKDGKADVWDSGKVQFKDGEIPRMTGSRLEAGKDYWWKVKVWTEKGESRYSESKAFHTASILDVKPSHYPLAKDTQEALSVTELSSGLFLASFEKDAFAQPELCFDAPCDSVIVRLGEKLDSSGHVDRTPGGTIRFAEYTLKVSSPGSYRIELRRDARNAKGWDDPMRDDSAPVLMPDYVGEVYPFRYLEIEGQRPSAVRRYMVHYPFNDEESSFKSSDETLNAVWDLCKYSIKETSFCGYYVDGDRERIPYEADALLNQLSHYGVDREYTLARKSLDYLLLHPTWPTEWQLAMPLMAWYDYLYTGDKAMLEKHYDVLVAKSLRALRRDDGLVTTVGTQDESFLESINYKDGLIRDIVDWPRVGGFGAPGEDDAYDMVEVNTVVNAFHAEALKKMSLIAEALGKNEDASLFAAQAKLTADTMNELLFDKEEGAYIDGIGSRHHALHASLFPLAFGLVPQEHKASVLSHIEAKGMVCSVYASQFLLEGLYDNGAADYGFGLMTNKSDRGWYNMLREGSTVSLEAWGFKYKPNLDWNHAWGAAPANIIPRKIAGVEPLVPGCRLVRVQPHIDGLEWMDAVVPTILGQVGVKYSKENGKNVYDISIPAGMEAQITLSADGETMNVGSGKHHFTVD